MSSSTRSELASTRHPFYPPELNNVDYIPNSWNTLPLLAKFFSGWIAIAIVTVAGTKWYRPRLQGWDQAAIIWFMLCGIIHMFFEGYFSLNHDHMASQQDFFGQLWKEYGMSDSRYITSDPFVLCMESVTAWVEGPLSFCTAYLILVDSPWRHPVQALVSTGQLYGDILYFSTNHFTKEFHGITYSRPESFYFYGYYVFMNLWWIIIPGAYIWQSMNATVEAVRLKDRRLTDESCRRIYGTSGIKVSDCSE